jgi:hypothetical protein
MVDATTTSNHTDDSDEERQGLLSGVPDPSKDPASVDHENENWWQTPWSDTKVAAFAIISILLLIGATIAHIFVVKPIYEGHSSTTPVQATTSNGTHEFKRTVLLVSIDGLR